MRSGSMRKPWWTHHVEDLDARDDGRRACYACARPAAKTTAEANFVDLKGKETGRAHLTAGDDGVLFEVEISDLEPRKWVAEDGVMRAQTYSTMVRLDDPERGIRGRALIVHAGSDEYRNDPAGGAGDRIACAVIE